MVYTAVVALQLLISKKLQAVVLLDVVERPSSCSTRTSSTRVCVCVCVCVCASLAISFPLALLSSLARAQLIV